MIDDISIPRRPIIKYDSCRPFPRLRQPFPRCRDPIARTNRRSSRRCSPYLTHLERLQCMDAPLRHRTNARSLPKFRYGGRSCFGVSTPLNLRPAVKSVSRTGRASRSPQKAGTATVSSPPQTRECSGRPIASKSPPTTLATNQGAFEKTPPDAGPPSSVKPATGST